MSYSGKNKGSFKDDKSSPLNSSPFESMPKKSISSLTKTQFFLFFIIQLFSCADSGVIISSSTNIISDLGIDDYQFGLIGAMPSLGRALSAIIFIYLMKRIDNKMFFIFGIVTKGIISIVCYYSKSYPFFISSRFIFGFFQMFEMVYFPGWCEEHIPNNNLVLFLIQLAKPIGFVVGFYICVKEQTSLRWSTNFLILGIILIIFMFIFGLIPSSNFICTKTIYNKKRKFSNKATNDEIEKGGNIPISTHNEEDDLSPDDDKSYSSCYISMDDAKSNGSYISGGSGTSNKSGDSSHSPFSKFIQMIKQPHYIFPTLAYTGFLFIISPIEFHLNEYMTTAMGIYDHYHILFVFAIIVLISPLLGILLNIFINGLLFQNTKHKRLGTTFILFFISCLLSVFIPLAQSLQPFILLTWISIIFSTFALPTLNNISIGATFYVFKLEAFVLTNVLNNLLGNFAGILLYGYLNEKHKGSNSKYAMTTTANCLWGVLLLVGISAYFSWNLPERKPRKKRKNERSEGTNYLRLTRTSDVSKDVIKVSGDIVPGGRTTIIDDDDSSVDDVSRKSYDEDHAFSLNYLLQNKNNQ